MNRSVSFFILFLFFYFSPLSARGQSAEDAAYEDRMRSIYLKHYKDPVPYSDWSRLIQSLGESYQLRHKDNFWDLSGSFFRNPLYWSKLWVANPKTENPHRIFKGNFIKFDPKTLEDTVKSKYSVDIASQFPDVELPPQERVKKALKSEQFPLSLPFLKKPAVFSDSFKVTFRINPSQIKKEALLPFYLSDEELEPQGKVISKDGYGTAAFNGEDVIVEMSDSVIQGGLYTVLENLGSFKPRALDFSDHGYEIKVKGEVRILSYLSESENMYRARVTKSLSAVSPGDKIIQGPAPIYLLSQRGSYGSVNGKIIGAPEGARDMLDLYSIVYLNKGEADGIRPGDIYQIRAVTQYRDLKRPYQYEKAPVGSLRVIHSNSQRATAIITESATQIFAGDIFTNARGFVEDLSKSQSHEEIGDIIEKPSVIPEEEVPEWGEETTKDESYMDDLEEYSDESGLDESDEKDSEVSGEQEHDLEGIEDVFNKSD